MLAIVIKHWKALALLAALAALSGGVWYVQHTAYNRGYDKAMAEYEAARINAAKVAQKKITDIRQRQNDAERNIDDALNDDCDLVYSTINSLRK